MTPNYSYCTIKIQNLNMYICIFRQQVFTNLTIQDKTILYNYGIRASFSPVYRWASLSDQKYLMTTNIDLDMSYSE